MPTGSQYTAELQFQPRAIPSPKSATFITRLTRLPERTLNEAQQLFRGLILECGGRGRRKTRLGEKAKAGPTKASKITGARGQEHRVGLRTGCMPKKKKKKNSILEFIQHRTPLTRPATTHPRALPSC